MRRINIFERKVEELCKCIIQSGGDVYTQKKKQFLRDLQRSVAQILYY